tara:strand:- start:1611 stop:1880 length:270 start_codon:yes stop_codon:yes gene_type:complete
MKKTGTLNTGVQETTKNKLDVRADNKTVLQADSSGLTGHVSSSESGIFRNPATINSTVTISADENAVMAGPVTISSTGSLVVEGTLVIV